MSALLGFIAWGRDDFDHRHTLDPMIETLQHRFRNLRILRLTSVTLADDAPSPLPPTRQPIAQGQAAKGLYTVADARIDNRDDLVRSLRLSPSGPHCSTPNTEVICAAHEKWGATCPAHLQGAFSFAIWNARRQTLFCARDPLGIKPFYYCFLPNRLFAFSSEIRALLTLDAFRWRVNENRIGDYLAGIPPSQVQTYYRDLFRLAPGHILQVSKHTLDSHAYWEATPDYSMLSSSPKENASTFRRLLTEAVFTRFPRQSAETTDTALQRSGKVGVLLSGGLDSNSIVALALSGPGAAGRGVLPTFSACFPTVPDSDERSAIGRALAHYYPRVVPSFVDVDGISPLLELEKFHQATSEPREAPNSFVQWALLKAAKRADITILCDGFDGDTTVSHGYPYLAELAGNGNWIHLFYEALALSIRMGWPLTTVLRDFVIRPWMPRHLRTLSRIVRNGGPSIYRGYDWISPEFAKRTDLYERLHRDVSSRIGIGRSGQRLHRVLLQSPRLTHSLEVANASAAAFGIEYRYPFFDRKLIEFCLALPSSEKLSSGWTRSIHRRSLSQCLPAQICWRPVKVRPTTNFVRTFIASEKETIASALTDTTSLIGTYVDVGLLMPRLAQMTSLDGELGPFPRATVRDTMILWRTLTLALWLKTTTL